MENNNTNIGFSGERYSFYELFSKKDLRIEIPIIQRDYAQGRETQKEVRSVFLDALYGYLDKGKPFNDLDFVYGSILSNSEAVATQNPKNKKNIFVPLDGQQRLTTLFLLHWYLAQISGKADIFRNALVVDKQSRFTYETRDSSKTFCNALINNEIDLNNLLKDDSGKGSVAETIKDKSWFYLSWVDDPTIRAMLTMLDAIHEKFNGRIDYFDKLVDPESPVITFRMLDLNEFNLTDDLYIKMNARGKPLTEFENFKAQFEKCIKQYKEQWPEYRLNFSDKAVSGYEYFIHKIDNDWADLFWTYRNKLAPNNTFDNELMNFIALAIANFEILKLDSEGENNKKIREKLYGQGGKLNKLSFIEYEKIGCFSQQFLFSLIELFDLINHKRGFDKQIVPYLLDETYYSEEEYFKKILTNNTTYPEKLRFYAFYSALSNGFREEDLCNWTRVIYNLTENTIFNDAKEFHSALKSIHNLTAKKVPIHELLKQDVLINGFTAVQVIEEKIKACLIEKSLEWKNAILQVESHAFFKGQIGFILKFAGIVDYYQINKNCNWNESDEKHFSEFRRYAKSASAVFNRINITSKEINFAWERAVLSKGNYFSASSAGRYNLLSSRTNRNNIDRDHSWKRLLRLSVNVQDSWNEKQGYVKAVLDDDLFDASNIQVSLESICNLASQNLNSKDWRYLLINEPGLLEICQQGFIVINSHEIVLLHQLQRNHYHSEIYSQYLDMKLERGLKEAPFDKYKYESVKSSDDDTFIKFSGFNYLGVQYAMEVWYKSSHYSIFFHTLSTEPCNASLISILEKCGFTLIKDININCIAILSHHEAGYIFRCDSVEEAMEILKKTLSELKTIKEQL